MSLVEFSNVSKIYKMGEVTIKAVDDISFSIEEGEFAIVVGTSGAGKTTLLNILGGMDSCSSGNITVNGKVISGLKEKALAAHRIGINTVIIPYDNKKDLEEIPQSVLDTMTFIPVKSVDEVLKNALSDCGTYDYVSCEVRTLSELRQ